MMWTDSFLWALGFSALVAVVVAVAGGVLTEIGPWYRGLRKPSWQPPDWAFSIVALMVVLGAQSTTAGLLMVPYLVWV